MYLRPQKGSLPTACLVTAHRAANDGVISGPLSSTDCETAHSALCRSRANALSAFQEGVQALAVKGTPWDVQQPVSGIAVEIDAHISKLRAQKVMLTAHPLSVCSSIC